MESEEKDEKWRRRKVITQQVKESEVRVTYCGGNILVALHDIKRKLILFL